MIWLSLLEMLFKIEVTVVTAEICFITSFIYAPLVSQSPAVFIDVI